MDLSICVPSFNRAHYLIVLVPYVAELLRRAQSLSFEIVVSDNHSFDGTPEVCEELGRRFSNFRVVHPPKHVPTAEENLRYGLSRCEGRYVWILGDDDDPCPAGVDRLIEYVREDELDLVIFNSRSQDYDGKILKQTRIECSLDEWKGSLLDFVQRTGVWFVIAGFSTILIKNPRAQLEVFDIHLGISKIYSHVTWIIEAYSPKAFAFCNTPLVWYRQNYSDVAPTDHWVKVAAREHTFDKGIWTNRFLTLMDRLVMRGRIERHFVSTIIDRNLDRRFMLSYEILRHFINQLLLLNTPGKLQPHFSISDFDYFIEWAEDLFPGQIAILHHLNAARSEYIRLNGTIPSAIVDKLIILMEDRASRPWQDYFLTEKIGNYELFHSGSQFWAVRTGCRFERASHLDDFHIRPAGDDVLIGETLPALRRAVLEAID